MPSRDAEGPSPRMDRAADTHCFSPEATAALASRHSLSLADDGYIPAGRYAIGVFSNRDFPCSNGELKPSCIYSVRTGRFSDGLICIAKAVLVALMDGIPLVYLEDSPNTRSIFPSISAFTVYGVSIIISSPPTAGETMLKGRFFGLRLGRDVRCRLPRLYQIIHSFAPYTDLPIIDRPLPEGTLTLHVRSGDIFSKLKPNPGYGQPSFSFYRICIEHFSPSSIVLICEDTRNPVIGKIAEYCEGLSLPLRVQSSSLRSDVATMLRSHSIVIGSGTFAPGIIALSMNARNVYVYQHSKTQISLPDSVRQFTVMDSCNDYYLEIMNGTWANLDWQQELMVSYPVDSLSISENRPSSARLWAT